MLLKSSSFFSSPVLPVSLYRTFASHSLDWHDHEFVEIAILFEGEATYENDFTAEHIIPGDVMVIPPGGRHRYYDERNVVLMNLLFQHEQLPFPDSSIRKHPGFIALFGMHPEYYKKRHVYPKLHLDPETLSQVRKILEPAWMNQEKSLPYALLGVYGAFLQIIPYLLNSWTMKDYQPKEDISARLADAICEMEENFTKKFHIPTLAKSACMSESAFSRHFRIATGMTPVRYLLTIRLRHAANLLQQGLSVAEAAFASGFPDSNYFSRMFRQQYGMTPRGFSNLPKFC